MSHTNFNTIQNTIIKVSENYKIICLQHFSQTSISDNIFHMLIVDSLKLELIVGYNIVCRHLKYLFPV